jgi:hypothetical protein
MNRVLVAASLAASLIATNLMAAEVNSALPPAGAAGVHQAQDINYMPLLVIGGGLGIIAAVALSQESPAPITGTAPGLVNPAVGTP